MIIVRRAKRTTITVQTGGRIINYKAWSYIAVTFDERSQMLTIWVNSKPVVRRTIGKVQLDTRKAIRTRWTERQRGILPWSTVLSSVVQCGIK